MNNFVKYCVDKGGAIYPIIIPSTVTKGTGLMNPSIFNDNGSLILNLRHVNYTFYHSERKTFQHQYGPLTYLHPENDIHLRTWNWLINLDSNIEILDYKQVDTSSFDTYEPLWDFVGLEDARLVRWDNKLYLTGVRRDTTTNGQGRMELSEILDAKEVSRVRIEPPVDKNSYCEKNWMPVLDIPYHFIKWSNPTELVEVDITTGTSKIKHLSDTRVPLPRDIRGGSQVIPFEDGYLAVTHEVDLFNSPAGRKDAVYKHRFIFWDKLFNIFAFSEDFSFMSGHVEFSVGLCNKDDKYYISFSFQDNAAFVLETSAKTIIDFLNARFTT